MMSGHLSDELLEAVRRTAAELPAEVARGVAVAIAASDGPPGPARDKVIHTLGQPHFRDSVSDLFEAWSEMAPDMTGAVIGAALLAAAFTVDHFRETEQAELLWTGPDTKGIPLRRTDQALIQLIRSAERTVTLVSFAVYKFQPILVEISNALKRNVDVRLILESQSESGGKVSFDMLGPVIQALPSGIKIYVWPLQERPKNEKGQHGSLHAKCAVADSKSLFISSANLTEYAFSLNMEMGVLIRGGQLPDRVQSHFSRLIEAGVLHLV
ncbi:DISARM system phospholipase D-like protein DrmC [Candidatus Sumerlaeota bacterium]